FDTITYTIDNLSSGTDYNFTLEYKWDTDNSTSSGNFGTVTTTAITEPKFKEENPTNITATSLDLNWGFDLNAANENEIAPTLATMLIKSESLEKDIVVENLAARTFKITGLEPETSHTFSLHYTWNEDKAASGSFTPVSTKPATITPPEFIKEDASNVTATSLDLNWGFNLNAANENEIAPVLSSMIIKSESLESDIVIKEMNIRTLKIDGLTSGTSYDFTLEYTWNDTSVAITEKFDIVTTTVVTPPKFEASAASDVTTTSITLNWELNLVAEDTGIAPVLSSMIIKSESLENDITISNLDAKTFKIEGLTPETSYNFELEYKWNGNNTAIGIFGSVSTVALPIYTSAFVGFEDQNTTLVFNLSSNVDIIIDDLIENIKILTKVNGEEHEIIVMKVTGENKSVVTLKTAAIDSSTTYSDIRVSVKGKEHILTDSNGNKIESITNGVLTIEESATAGVPTFAWVIIGFLIVGVITIPLAILFINKKDIILNFKKNKNSELKKDKKPEIKKDKNSELKKDKKPEIKKDKNSELKKDKKPVAKKSIVKKNK
ncbi:MAG: fibronectin type III domain-containing protein, partial [Mycoplasmataceae bacterium]|nr:fibronectin type III domain-containing protein [Mycoplasmataceae bacterium]